MESTAAAAEAAETAARNALRQRVALRTAVRLDESNLSLGFGGPSAFLAACSLEELATLLADNAWFRTRAEQILSSWCPLPSWIVDLLTSGGDLQHKILEHAVCAQTIAIVPAVCEAWRSSFPGVLDKLGVLRPNGLLLEQLFPGRVPHALPAPPYPAPIGSLDAETMLSLPDGRLAVRDDAPEPAGTLPPGLAVISTQGEAHHVIDNFQADTFEWVHDNGTTIYIAVADAATHFHGVMSYSLPDFAPLAQVNLFAANAQHNAINHGLVISGIAYHEAQIFVSSLRCYDHGLGPAAQPPPCVIVIDVAADGSMAFRRSFGQAWLQAPTSIVAFQDLTVGATRLIIADSINTDAYADGVFYGEYESPALHVCAVFGNSAASPAPIGSSWPTGACTSRMHLRTRCARRFEAGRGWSSRRCDASTHSRYPPSSRFQLWTTSLRQWHH